MNDKNRWRTVTCVFRIEDNEKFAPVYASIRDDILVLGARLTSIAEGDVPKELERELNVWRYLSDALMDDHGFDELWDDISPKQDWKNTDDWDIARCVSEIAKVWQPEEGCL